MTKLHLLLIAFHLPPCDDGSGHLRLLSLSQHLVEAGWQVTILAPAITAYKKFKLLRRPFPPGVDVIRAPAHDAADTYAIAGRYPQMFAMPDRWRSWIKAAVKLALKQHQQTPFDAILSSYPIASAHAIALRLSQQTGVPWLADFRDPMHQTNYPSHSKQRALFQQLNDQTVDQAQAVILNTQAALQYYQLLYPNQPHKLQVIYNGFDGELVAAEKNQGHDKQTLGFIHLGQLDREERNPRPFLACLPQFSQVQCTFAGSGSEPYYRQLAENQIANKPEWLERQPYEQGLQLLIDADVGLLFQGADNNLQLPAKLFEYIKHRKPILALTHPLGETAGFIRDHQLGVIADINNPTEIAAAILQMTRSFKQFHERMQQDDLIQFSRHQQNQSWLALLTRCVT